MLPTDAVTTLCDPGIGRSCHRVSLEIFKFSQVVHTDGRFRSVGGFDLNPPERAVVHCVREKECVRAVDRKR